MGEVIVLRSAEHLLLLMAVFSGQASCSHFYFLHSCLGLSFLKQEGHMGRALNLPHRGFLPVGGSQGLFPLLSFISHNNFLSVRQRR